MIIRSLPSTDSDAEGHLSCTLTVWAVFPGTGTTGKDLSYRYRFSMPPIVVNNASTLTVTLESIPKQPNTYVMHSYASTSPGIAVPRSVPLPFPASAGQTTLDFDLNLTPNELAFLSIIVIDTSRTPVEPYELIYCDPQVANDAKT